jgi:NACalpha-BTF3-like transcription factor
MAHERAAEAKAAADAGDLDFKRDKHCYWCNNYWTKEIHHRANSKFVRKFECAACHTAFKENRMDPADERPGTCSGGGDCACAVRDWGAGPGAAGAGPSGASPSPSHDVDEEEAELRAPPRTRKRTRAQLREEAERERREAPVGEEEREQLVGLIIDQVIEREVGYERARAALEAHGHDVEAAIAALRAGWDL